MVNFNAGILARKENERLQNVLDSLIRKLLALSPSVNVKPCSRYHISSCVLNNGFSTAPFSVDRGVRQGDPLSPYLFIIVLETLCISIRRSKDIQGITVDTEDIKLGLFADDLTGFLMNDISLQKF